MITRQVLRLALAGVVSGGAAGAAELGSVSRLAFAPDGTLFVADWKAAQVDALTLPAAGAGADAPFNILDLDAVIQTLLGSADIRLEALAKRPGSNEVYLAVSAGPDRRPAILAFTPDGAAHALELGEAARQGRAARQPAGRRRQTLGPHAAA